MFSKDDIINLHTYGVLKKEDNNFGGILKTVFIKKIKLFLFNKNMNKNFLLKF